MWQRGGTWRYDILAGTLSVYYNQVGKRREMWLSLLLFARRSFPGRQWTGKHRKVKKITYNQRQNKKKDAGIVAEVNSHTHFNKSLPPPVTTGGGLLVHSLPDNSRGRMPDAG